MAIGKKDGVLDPSGGILAATEETNWDWFHKYVERASFADAVVTSQSTLILAGPAIYTELSDIDDNIDTSGNIEKAELLTPIGFVQDMRYQEQQPVNRNYEIGSGRSRFTVGKSRGSGSIARAMFDADTLLTVLMRNATAFESEPHVKSFLQNGTGFQYGAGLWGDAFKIPFGMAIAYKTIGNDFVASVFLEQCYIMQHNVTINEGQAMIIENVAFVFDRARTVNIRAGGPEGITDNNS